MHPQDRYTRAALSALILLQIIMLSALYAGIKPHPPVTTPLFGIAPFLGASVAIAFAAILVQPVSNVTGRSLSICAALMALVSFGPQKYFDQQFSLIWPAVIVGQLATIVVFAAVIRAIQEGRKLPPEAETEQA